MCGRTACALDRQKLAGMCASRCKSSTVCKVELRDCPSGNSYTPSYNLAPGDFTPVLIACPEAASVWEQAALQTMRWGLIPHFAHADSTPYSTSNARLESLLQKPTYSFPMLQGRRCVVLAQGFYEWKVVDGRKQPYFIRPFDSDHLLMLAGVYNYSPGRKLFSYSIITTDSLEPIASIHHRMPVILTSYDDVEMWLDTANVTAKEALLGLESVAAYLKPSQLSIYPVTPAMNKTTYNQRDCIQPIDLKEHRKSLERKHGEPSIMSSFLKRIHEKGSEFSEPKVKKQPCSPEAKTNNSSTEMNVETQLPGVKREMKSEPQAS